MDVVDLQDNLTQPKQDNETVEGEKIKVENCIEMDGGDYLVEGDALLEDEETFEESLAVSFEGGNSNERNIMQEDILAEPINKSVEVLTSIKTENSQDTSNGMEDNKNDAIQKFTQKRKKENSGWSSDEEFCGFDENVKSETTGVLKKLKKESMELERHENTDLTTTPSTKIIEKRNVGRTVQLTDPIYRKPFEYGWKRELVLRAIPDISKDKGEVYYITPGGKKLRTRSEIHVNLHDDLQLHHFTLAKEALGADPHDEIIRMAKTSSGTPIARRNMTSVSEPIADQSSPVLGKRIPKPKAPKGSSPTPPSFIKGPSKSNRSNSTPTLKKMDSKDIIKQSTTDTDSKINVTPLKSIKPTTTAGKHTTTKTSKGEPCTIQCVLAMGTIPQLQCCVCLCLYHHECVGMEKFDGPIKNYTCLNCKNELSQQESLPTPPPLQLQQPDIPAQVQQNLPNSNKSTLNKSTLISGHQHISRSRRQSKETIVNSMTAWHPASSNIITNRNLHQNFNDTTNTTTTPPQTIAIVNGKKFIVVPKMNVLSVSPSGGGSEQQHNTKAYDNRNKYSSGNGGNSGNENNSNRNEQSGYKQQQQSHRNSDGTYVTSTSTTVGTPSPSSPSLTTAPVTIQQQQLPSVPMTGDASPVQKRRLTGSTTATGGGGGGISNIQTIQSPIHITQENSSTIITPTQNRITSPFNINNKINSTMLMKTNRPKYGQQLSGSGSASSSGGNMVCSEFSFSTNFFTNVSIGYDILLHTFQYLKVQELLRASCVCRLWNQAGNHSSLWKTVRMKNSQVNDWNGMANTLIKNGTKHLDLRKMLAPKNSDDSWKKFTEIIGNVQNLESIDLCKCSVNVVESLFQTNQNLKIINAVTLKDEELNLEKLSNLKILTELRIKSSIGLNIINLQSIKDLILIRHLSLTSVHSLGKISIDVIGNLINLESLELGECCDFSINFTTDVLPKLIKLERLRLEKGQDNCCTFDILDGIAKMKNLLQLELINFDIRTNFDEHLSNCKNLKKLLLIPTYVSQSATTNQIVLNGVMKLFETLINFTWAVTGELVRVTELYVDTCDSNNKKTKKTLSDCIPVLKPVPGILENTQIMSKRVKSDVPQVEILPLSSVEKILNAALPDTKVKMVIIPYHATWRQNLVDI